MLPDLITAPGVTSPVKIFYRPTLPDFAPGDAGCRHDGAWDLTLGGRIVKHQWTVDAVFCMRCGSFHVVSAEYIDWADAFADLWTEFGWHAGIGRRLMDFAELMAGGSGFRTALLLAGHNPDTWLHFENGAQESRWEDEGGAIVWST